MVLLKRALAHKPNDLKKATFTLAYLYQSKNKKRFIKNTNFLLLLLVKHKKGPHLLVGIHTEKLLA